MRGLFLVAKKFSENGKCVKFLLQQFKLIVRVCDNEKNKGFGAFLRRLWLCFGYGHPI